MSTVIPYIVLAISYGTPILFGTLGGIIAEKSGNINLGIEGMMLMGAYAGFQTSLVTGNIALSICASMLFGGFGALIYAILTVSLKANQIVTGLALTIFGSGLSRFLINLNRSVERVPDSVHKYLKPFFSDVLGIQNIKNTFFQLFDVSILVYVAIILAILMHVYLNKTRIGLNVRAIGENLGAADAAGININLYKYIHIVVGGALCGLGGAYLSLYYIPVKTEDFVTGTGWISVALVIFVLWRPLRAVWGAILFGGLAVLSKVLQSHVQISPYLLDSLPFVVTIFVLIMTSVKMTKENMQPKSCGINYFREER